MAGTHVRRAHPAAVLASLAAILASLPAAMPLVAGTPAAMAQDGPATGLGAETPVFSDTFDEPGAWNVASDDRGELAYDAGGFAISVARDAAGLWSEARVSDGDVAWRVEGDVALEPGHGAAGLGCGSVETGDFLLGAVTPNDLWAIGAVHGDAMHVLAAGGLPGAFEPSATVTMHLALDCAVTGAEADHVILSADTDMLGAVEAAPHVGPYGLAGLYATSDDAPWSARFDDVSVSSGPLYRPPAVTGLGADELVGTDDFSASQGWGTPSGDYGAVTYDDAALLLALTASNSNIWSWRDLASGARVVRLEGDVGLAGSGSAGFLCGSPATDPAFLVAEASTTGEWLVGRVTAGTGSLIARGPLPAGVDPSTGPLRLAVECATLPDDGGRVAVWVDGRFAGATSAIPGLGPFDVVGMYAASLDGPLEARIDDLVVNAGTGYTPVLEG